MLREFKTKLQRVRAFLRRRKLGGCLLSTRANFAWLTCGRANHVRLDAEKGVASLWVTPHTVELWCNSIEAPRFREEETKGLPFKYKTSPWTEGLTIRLPKGRVGSDDGAYGTLNLREAICALRESLTPEEITRYRKVGRLAGGVMEEAALRVKPGWTEQNLAAELAGGFWKKGLEPSVVLVGADERLKRYRHPLPTSRKILKAVMMVVCAKGQGLIVCLTRILQFGPVPEELNRRHLACLQVECAMWSKTKPGTAAGEVFNAAVWEYAKQGFAGEWQKHHQGGPTGYEARDYLAAPGEKRNFVENQAVAWNPSITGTKSEDTVLMSSKGLEVLTATPHWPRVRVRYDGRDYLRPAIWVRKG